MRVRRWASMVGLLVGLNACGGAGTAAVNTVAVATPQATATLEASAVPASTIAPDPTPSLVPVAVQPTPTLVQATPTMAEVVETEAPVETVTQTSDQIAVRSDLDGKIAFVRGTDLWLYRPRTGEVRQLINDTTDARWSPNGKSIAFVRTDGLYLADGEGKNERQIYGAGHLTTPVWSPDGSRLAFEIGLPADPPDMREVWVYELAGSEPRKVAMGMDPAWAPDSKRIAYVTAAATEGFRRNELHLVSFQGENDWAVVKDLPPNLPRIGVPDMQPDVESLAHIMTTPVWDKDGRYIYMPSFLLYQVLVDFYAWERADATNGGSTFISELSGGDAMASPDKQAALISSVSARGDTWFVARALGGDDDSWAWAETPNGITALAPAWAPDSQAVAYYHCELDQPEQCVLNLLTPDGDATLIPDVFEGVAPDYARMPTLSWGSDG